MNAIYHDHNQMLSLDHRPQAKFSGSTKRFILAYKCVLEGWSNISSTGQTANFVKFIRSVKAFETLHILSIYILGHHLQNYNNNISDMSHK